MAIVSKMLMMATVKKARRKKIILNQEAYAS